MASPVSQRRPSRGIPKVQPPIGPGAAFAPSDLQVLNLAPWEGLLRAVPGGWREVLGCLPGRSSWGRYLTDGRQVSPAATMLP